MKNRLAQKKTRPEAGLFQSFSRGGAFLPETSPIYLSVLKRLIINVLLGLLKDETCFGKLSGGVEPMGILTVGIEEGRCGGFRVCLPEGKSVGMNYFGKKLPFPFLCHGIE